MPDSNPPEPEPAEITLEEWIASCQSCCGIEPEAWHAPKPNANAAGGDAVQLGDAPQP